MNTLPDIARTEPTVLMELQERASMALLRLIAAAGLAVTLLGLALRIAG